MEDNALKTQYAEIETLIISIDQFCSQYNDYVLELCHTARNVKNETIASGIAEVFINRISHHIQECFRFLKRIDQLKLRIFDEGKPDIAQELYKRFSNQLFTREDILDLQVRIYTGQRNRILKLHANLQTLSGAGVEEKIPVAGQTCQSVDRDLWNKRIDWTGSNKLEILALFELLENAGFIGTGSCKNAGSIISSTFQKNKKEISRNYINGKKRDPVKYLKWRLKLMEKIITGLDVAYDKLSKMEEECKVPDYLAD